MNRGHSAAASRTRWSFIGAAASTWSGLKRRLLALSIIDVGAVALRLWAVALPLPGSFPRTTWSACAFPAGRRKGCAFAREAGASRPSCTLLEAAASIPEHLPSITRSSFNPQHTRARRGVAGASSTPPAQLAPSMWICTLWRRCIRAVGPRARISLLLFGASSSGRPRHPMSLHGLCLTHYHSSSSPADGRRDHLESAPAKGSRFLTRGGCVPALAAAPEASAAVAFALAG